jgi:colanic acid biosynthesis glycosyl transferase WcaI
MKINVWGINYAPELTGIAPYNTALCEHLERHGHDVGMVTSFAYYPSWTKQQEDRGRLFRTDRVRSVPVHRCWHYVPRKANTLKRIIHEGTFVAASFLRQLTLPAPDAYVVVSPPLLLGTAAWMLGKIKRRPFVFHVQDLQPDAAAGLGMLKQGAFVRALYWLEAFAYRKAARVSGITTGMLDAFRQKGVPEEKLETGAVPQWRGATRVRDVSASGRVSRTSWLDGQGLSRRLLRQPWREARIGHSG